ncbi:MAG: SsrA-binding protein SmpB [Eggerthellaceae bacterium]|jgi:SsrA-binding protein|nr:SsrA-binding protein SmpB [Eggerthellaceae bacterium]
MKREERLIAKNRKAFHEYEILRTFEVGIVLTGTEVCSLRESNCQLTDCFALIRNGEVWLNNLHIHPYSHGNLCNPEPDRRRKLLLHRNEIRALSQETRERGMALIPIKMYFTRHNLVKVELAVCKGKKLYDKRASMAARDSQRSIERVLKQQNRR